MISNNQVNLPRKKKNIKNPNCLEVKVIMGFESSKQGFKGSFNGFSNTNNNSYSSSVRCFLGNNVFWNSNIRKSNVYNMSFNSNSKMFIYSDSKRKLNLAVSEKESYFWNQTFDKGRLKNFVLWFLKKYGEYKTVLLVEELKNVGFQYATKAGISLGIEDLKIPKKKYTLLMEAEQLSLSTLKQYKRGEITGVERFQRLIDTWHRTSERLKQEVIDNFESTDILNPVYMMAFSGARGNISQVRQLVGMRGLMSNPQGQIIDFPIRSNFREGLTLTEYIISSYGARKGIVDTALRTANAGYLTRRLVDVAQHVIISNFDCRTKHGIFLTDMKEGNKIIYSLQSRLVGRVLAKDMYNDLKIKVASRNTEISVDLATSLARISTKVFVRSSLTCKTKKLVCQLCYGWSLAQGNLVSIGEAVGVVAAQSIGEPGTQLTMRTFHTGGVFSGDVSDQIRAPFDGVVKFSNPIAGTLIRTPEGKIAFLTKNEGSFIVESQSSDKKIKKFKIPFYTLLFLKNGEKVSEKEVIAQISSINRQKNTTDVAELTIKADFSGQFYSKFLDLKDNKVGPEKKNNGLNTGIIKSSVIKKQKKKSKEQIKELLSTAFDTIYEAWGWGYAWVLSGKIYQLALPSHFFPITGDYINSKSYMNQINWIIPSSFGTFLRLNPPRQKDTQFLNKTVIKEMRKKNSAKTQNEIDSLQLNLLKTSLISFEISKIVYKKFKYLVRVENRTSGFKIKESIEVYNDDGFYGNFCRFEDYMTYQKFFHLPVYQGEWTDRVPIISNKDKVLLLSPLNNNNDSDNQKNSVYPASWRPYSNILLNWLPKYFEIETGGLMLMLNDKSLEENETQLSLNTNPKSIFKTIDNNVFLKHTKFKIEVFDFKNKPVSKIKQKTIENKNIIPVSKNNKVKSHVLFPTFIKHPPIQEKINSNILKNLNETRSKDSSFQSNEQTYINIKKKLLKFSPNKTNLERSKIKIILNKNTTELGKALSLKQDINFVPLKLTAKKPNSTKMSLFNLGMNWKNSLQFENSLPMPLTRRYSKKSSQEEGPLKKIYSVFRKDGILPFVEQKKFLNTLSKFSSSNFDLPTFILVPQNLYNFNLRTKKIYPHPIEDNLISAPIISARDRQYYPIQKEINRRADPFNRLNLSDKPKILKYRESSIKKPTPILLQMNRQGNIKSFYVQDEFIQTNLPLNVKNESLIGNIESFALLGQELKKQHFEKIPSFDFKQLEKYREFEKFIESVNLVGDNSDEMNSLIREPFVIDYVSLENPPKPKKIIHKEELLKITKEELLKRYKKEVLTINKKGFLNININGLFNINKNELLQKYKQDLLKQYKFIKKKGFYYFRTFDKNLNTTLINRKKAFSKHFKYKTKINTQTSTQLFTVNPKINLNYLSLPSSPKNPEKLIQKSQNFNKQKGIKNFNPLNLKVYSKTVSLPYFLNSKSIAFLKSNLLSNKVKEKINNKGKTKNKGKTNKTESNNKSIFNFYFYSLFNKNNKCRNIFYSDSERKSSKQNDLKQICSPYLIDHSHFLNSRQNIKKASKKRTLQPLNLNLFNVHSRVSIINKIGLSKQKTILKKPNSNKICVLNVSPDSTFFAFDRKKQLQSWFKNSKFYKKFYLKNILKITTPLNILLNRRRLTTKKTYFKFLKQKRKINKLLQKKNKQPKSVIGSQKRVKPFFSKFKYMSKKINPSIDELHPVGVYKSKKINSNPPPLLNLMLKSGIIYYSPNLSKLLMYHKQFISVGSRIADDFVFMNKNVFLEIITFDKSNFKTYMSNPMTVKVTDSPDSIQLNFNKLIKNKKCRFEFISSKNTNLNSVQKKSDKIFLLLIRNTIKYNFIKDNEYKSKLYHFANQAINEPNQPYILDERLLQFDRAPRLGLPLKHDYFYQYYVLTQKDINKMCSDLNLKNPSIFSSGPDLKNLVFLDAQNEIHLDTPNVFYFVLERHKDNSNSTLYSITCNDLDFEQYFKTSTLNKQKPLPNIISKYPSPDLKIFSNNSRYYSLFELKQNLIHEKLNSKVNLNEFKSKLQLIKEKTKGVSCLSITITKPINLSPATVGYKVPYSLDFPFKKLIKQLKILPNPNYFNQELHKDLLIRAEKLDIDPDLLTKDQRIERDRRYPPKKTFKKESKTKNELFKDYLHDNLKKTPYLDTINFLRELNFLNDSNEADFLLDNLDKFDTPYIDEMLNPEHTSWMSVSLRLEKTYNRPNISPNIIFGIELVRFRLSDNISKMYSQPMLEYTLGKEFEKSICYPNNFNQSSHFNPVFNKNSIHNRNVLTGMNGPILGSLNQIFEHNTTKIINKEIPLYKSKFLSFKNHDLISPDFPFIKTYTFSSVEGEVIYKTTPNKNGFQSILSTEDKKQSNKKMNNLDLFMNRHKENSCMILTKKDLIAYYFPKNQNLKEIYLSLENLKRKNQYFINDMVINYFNIIDDQQSYKLDKNYKSDSTNEVIVKLNKLPAGNAQQKSKLLIGEFIVYGDQIGSNQAIPKSGRIIHMNNNKLTIRRGQPIFVSPKAVLHKYDGDFIQEQAPVITLAYQQLKTGDIIQGIPKVEQFFEARTTKRGRLFRDSLANLLKALFKLYYKKFPLEKAVRLSLSKIQQIIIDGVHRVYRSQGVTIADKHLEVIVKQMTSKVRIINPKMRGFSKGEIVDLDYIEKINRRLTNKIIYEPLVLGITKASLEVDSFLSAASFQQTTRVLSKSAIERKKDFLKGLKENVLLGNLMPAGTGALVYPNEPYFISMKKNPNYEIEKKQKQKLFQEYKSKLNTIEKGQLEKIFKKNKLTEIKDT